MLVVDICRNSQSRAMTSWKSSRGLAWRTWMAHSVVGASALPGTMGGGVPCSSGSSCRPGFQAGSRLPPPCTSSSARATEAASSSATARCPRSLGCVLQQARGAVAGSSERAAGR